jgi:transcriptional regulator with XRE-family HTH domain
MQVALLMEYPASKESMVAAQCLAMPDHPGSALPLGERLKQLRRERGWSQADLAAKVGADAGQISRYENGRMTPSAEAVVKLAEALDIATDYLLVDASPRRALHAPENILGDRLTAVAQLNDDELTVLNGVIDGLVAKNRLQALANDIN